MEIESAFNIFLHRLLIESVAREGDKGKEGSKGENKLKNADFHYLREVVVKRGWDVG